MKDSELARCNSQEQEMQVDANTFQSNNMATYRREYYDDSWQWKHCLQINPEISLEARDAL